MEIGTHGHVFRAPGDKRPLEELYRDVVEEGVIAEAKGYSFYHLSEFHFNNEQWNPSPLSILASIAARTSTIRLGPCPLLTPFYHPLRLVEDVATLDLLSCGRLDLIAGTGADLGNQFETYGIPASERFGRMFETLALLERSFAEEAFDHEGRYSSHRGVRMTTKPVQKPFPIWFCGFGPKTSRRAGRCGYHFHVGADFVPAIDEWLAGLSEGGHDPDRFNLGIHGADVVVVATAAEANAKRAEVEAAAEAHAAEYRSEAEEHRTGTIDGFVGTPDDILERFEPLLKHSRVTHLAGPHFSSNPVDLKSERLWLDEVVPVLRTWGRSPVPRKGGASSDPEP